MYLCVYVCALIHEYTNLACDLSGGVHAFFIACACQQAMLLPACACPFASRCCCQPHGLTLFHCLCCLMARSLHPPRHTTQNPFAASSSPYSGTLVVLPWLCCSHGRQLTFPHPCSALLPLQLPILYFQHCPIAQHCHRPALSHCPAISHRSARSFIVQHCLIA